VAYRHRDPTALQPTSQLRDDAWASPHAPAPRGTRPTRRPAVCAAALACGARVPVRTADRVERVGSTVVVRASGCAPVRTACQAQSTVDADGRPNAPPRLEPR